MQHHIVRRLLRVSAEIELMPSDDQQRLFGGGSVRISHTVVVVDSTDVHVCGFHGATMYPQRLVGRTVASVVASWHFFGTNAAGGPVDIWLIDGQRTSTHITVGSDWCLLVEEKAPFDGFDMGEHGRFEVTEIGEVTPFAPHVGRGHPRSAGGVPSAHWAGGVGAGLRRRVGAL